MHALPVKASALVGAVSLAVGGLGWGLLSVRPTTISHLHCAPGPGGDESDQWWPLKRSSSLGPVQREKGHGWLTMLVIDLKWDEWRERQRRKLEELDEEEAVVLEGRRNLVRQTKELKALSEAEQAQRRPELVKLYQQEIDRFATIIRRLHAEFKTSIGGLCRLPNPVPVLCESLESTGAKHDVLALQRENADLRDALGRAELERSDQDGKLRSKDASLQAGEDQVKQLMAQVVGLRQELEQKDSSVTELLAALAEQEKAYVSELDSLASNVMRLGPWSPRIGCRRRANGAKSCRSRRVA